jgi:hypothetical protein
MSMNHGPFEVQRRNEKLRVAKLTQGHKAPAALVRPKSTSEYMHWSSFDFRGERRDQEMNARLAQVFIFRFGSPSKARPAFERLTEDRSPFGLGGKMRGLLKAPPFNVGTGEVQLQFVVKDSCEG